MATLFLETPDATQGTQFWTTVFGSVTYDTTAARKKSGLASWKCDSGAGNAVASLYRTTAASIYRFSFYLYLESLPASTVRIAQILGSCFEIHLTSAGVLQLFYSNVQVGSDGSTLSTGTLYRLSLASSSTTGKVFLDGVEDISASGTYVSSASMYFGWCDAPGANKVLNFQHVYVDDDTGLTDTGDMRVTAKLPDEVNDNNYDTTGGTGAVKERPISETNYMMHAAKSSVLQDWTLETAAEGDVDISGDTLVARCAWMWSVHSKDGDTYYIVDDGDSSTGWSDQETATLNTKITDSALYPSNAAGIGQKSGAAAPDDYLYECGTLIAYTVAEAGETFYQSCGGGVTPTGALMRMTSKFPGGGISPSGAVVLKLELFRTYTGGITPSGALVKKTAKLLGGTMTSSGALGTVWTAVKALSGTLSSTGALTKKTLLGLAGTLTSAGTLAKKTSKSMAGTVTSAGGLVRKTSRSLAGNITPTGIVAASLLVLKSLAGTLTSSGGVTKKTLKVLTGALSSAGALAKKTSRTLSGALGSSGGLKRKIGKPLAGSITPTGALGRALLVCKSVAGTLTSAGSVATQHIPAVVTRLLALLKVGK